MAKKKKRAAAQYMALYARDDRRPDSKVPAVKVAFVLSATLEEAAEWHKKDRYGLTARGFHLCSTIRLSVVQRHNEQDLPTCGCYENAAFLYQIEVVK